MNLLPRELDYWQAHLEINSRGMYIDIPFVDNALNLADSYSSKIEGYLKKEYDLELIDINSPARFKRVLKGYGLEIESLAKQGLSVALTEDVDARNLIRVRQELSQSSTAKYKRMRDMSNSDWRLRGQIAHWGAHTGRSAGRGIQPHNLPRGEVDDLDGTIAAVEANSFEELSRVTNKRCMTGLKSCIRSAICAPDGKQLLIGDYASIEARVLAWLACEDDALGMFERGECLYVDMARQIYKDETLTKKNKTERALGKICILGLGYNMGSRTFISSAAAYGIEVDKKMAQRCVTLYRKKFSRIANLWVDLEAAMRATIDTRSGHETHGIEFRWMDAGVTITLPSGTVLVYRGARVSQDKILYKSVLSGGNLHDVTLYGGRLCENIVQAVAADLLKESILKVRPQYDIVLHVHDEIVAEVDEGTDPAPFAELMSYTPDWAEGLPILVEPEVSKRYKK